MFSFGKQSANKKNRVVQAALAEKLTGFSVHDGKSEKPLSHYVQSADIKDDTSGYVVTLTLKLPTSIDKSPETIHVELSKQLQSEGVRELNLNIIKEKVQSGQPANALPKTTNAASAKTQPTGKAPVQSQLPAHPRIKHIIVVASGKGGVGKSTTTVNLALALQKLGHKVGVLDADIYGPSIPTMLGVAGKTPEVENEQFVPINAYDMPVMSIGSLLSDDNTPVAWRGPKATGALMQLFNQTNWPQLDYLLIDMPPGTGDIQLTLAQRIPVTASVIVTTPQHIALLDAQKGIEMFRKVSIPVLGVVENMALHTCSSCGHTEAIFGAGGGEKLSDDYHVPLLGQLPLAAGIREQADSGTPSVIADDAYASYYVTIAQKIQEDVAKFAKAGDRQRIF